MMKKIKLPAMYLLALSMSLTSAGCTKKYESQMEQYNHDLENVTILDNYRNTYEIFPYSFYDSDDDGIGDLNGIDQKLNYISDLGFNQIWLMPISSSPTYHKYDITDYYSVDEDYGTLQDFEQLADDAHGRNMTVLIDLVINHTSSDHPWFQAAAEYITSLTDKQEINAAECPYVNYYHFSREYQSGYVPLDDTDWYYEARFWSGMPDLNLDDEAVRDEIRNIMSFWINEGADGFRLDAVTSYYTGNAQANIDFLKWLKECGTSLKEDIYFTAEAWTDQSEYASYYASGIDSFFDFAFANNDGIIAETAKGVYTAQNYINALIQEEELYSSFSQTYVNAPFYTNHDMSRGAGYYAGENAEKMTKLAIALNILQTGSVFVYYGEELGMKGSGKDENKRAPMLWSSESEAAGMTDGPDNMDTIKMIYGDLESQMNDPYSIYTYTKNALKIRNGHPSVARGRTVSAAVNDHISGFIRSWQDDDVLVIINSTDTEESADISAFGYTTLSNVLITDTDEITYEKGILTLPPFSIAFLTE